MQEPWRRSSTEGSQLPVPPPRGPQTRALRGRVGILPLLLEEAGSRLAAGRGRVPGKPGEPARAGTAGPKRTGRNTPARCALRQARRRARGGTQVPEPSLAPSAPGVRGHGESVLVPGPRARTPSSPHLHGKHPSPLTSAFSGQAGSPMWPDGVAAHGGGPVPSDTSCRHPPSFLSEPLAGLGAAAPSGHPLSAHGVRPASCGGVRLPPARPAFPSQGEASPKLTLGGGSPTPGPETLAKQQAGQARVADSFGFLATFPKAVFVFLDLAGLLSPVLTAVRESPRLSWQRQGPTQPSVGSEPGHHHGRQPPTAWGRHRHVCAERPVETGLRAVSRTPSSPWRWQKSEGVRGRVTRFKAQLHRRPPGRPRGALPPRATEVPSGTPLLASSGDYGVAPWDSSGCQEFSCLLCSSQ